MEAESNVNESPTETVNTQEGFMQKKGYLIIDHGEELKQQFKESKTETNKKIKELSHIIELMWEVLWNFIFISGQIAIGWTLMTFAKMTDINTMESCSVAINCGICINILVFDAPKLKDCIDQLMEALESNKSANQQEGTIKTDDQTDQQSDGKECQPDENNETQKKDTCTVDPVQTICAGEDNLQMDSTETKTVENEQNSKGTEL